MATFILLFLIFVLFVKVINLSTRVSTLEKQQGVVAQTTPNQASPVATSDAGSENTPDPVTVMNASVAPGTYIPQHIPGVSVPSPTAVPEQSEGVAPPPTPPPMPAQPPSDPFRWFKENTLIKLGALFFFLGAVWFVSYAINQGWISAEMRIYFGILTGIAIHVGAHFTKRMSEQQYLILTALGTAVIMASVYAGQFFFTVFAPLLAMVILLLAIAYTVVVSMQANAQWLCVLSAIAGLVAPLLINSPDPQAVLFFLYLLVLSGGFVAVVLKTKWRAVTLTLAVGTILYLLGYYEANYLSKEFTWLFTVLFSALFFLATTMSLYRTREPHPSDLTTLGIVSVAFLLFANEVALAAPIAAFASMLAVAGVGYYFHLIDMPKAIQRMYAGIAVLHLFVGTSLLFDGFTLTLAYALEVALIVAFAMYLKLSKKTIVISGWLVIIPIVTSLESLTSDKWDDGVLHADAWAVYVLTAAIGAVALWAITLVRNGHPNWYLSVAGSYAVLAYGYLVVTVGLVAGALLSESSQVVATYLGWTVISLVLYGAVCRLSVPAGWRIVVLSSFGLPIFWSIQSAAADTWRDGVVHADSAGLFAMILTTLAVAVVSLVRYFNSQAANEKIVAGVFVSLFWLYSVGYSALVIDTLFESERVSFSLMMVVWSVLGYALTAVFFRLPLPARWVATSIASLILPGLLALAALLESPWSDGPLSIEAVSLYCFTIILVLIGITLHRELPHYQGDKTILQPFVTPMFVIAAAISVRLVWMVTHSIFEESDYAVTIALFIYTVTGLYLYRLGSVRRDRQIRLVGILLLAIVVGRLLLIEARAMDPFWKIVTFLGIGTLFIATAIAERRQQKQIEENSPEEQLPNS